MWDMVICATYGHVYIRGPVMCMLGFWSCVCYGDMFVCQVRCSCGMGCADRRFKREEAHLPDVRPQWG